MLKDGISDGYQVFIAFKNADDEGKQTRDSIIATKVFNYLTKKGLRVFNSTITLEKNGISEYKKSIDEALDMAKVLVVVGTSASNLNSKWVRYEWDSFFNDILCGIKPNGRIFTYIDDIKPTELPRALRQTQSIKHGSESMYHLYGFIKNALRVEKEEPKEENVLDMKIEERETFALSKISGEGPEIINIPFKKSLVIGKKRENDIVLNLKQISRHHAKIVHNEKGLYVYDLNSTNGTYVNNVRIKNKMLEEEDIVSFDIIKYKVCILSKEMAFKSDITNGN